MRSTSAALWCCLLATAISLASASAVIAAPGIADHGPATAEAGSLLRSNLFVGCALAASAVLFVARRRGWFTLREGVLPRSNLAPWLVGGYFALFCVQVVAVLAVYALLGKEGDPLRRQAITATALYLAQLPVALAILRLLPRDAMRPGGAIAAGCVGIALMLPVILAASTLAGFVQSFLTGVPQPGVAHQTLTLLLEAPAGLWTALLLAGALIGAPFFEEVAYRGAFQGALRAGGLRPWPAIICTSALFLLVHVPAIPSEGRAAAFTGLFLLSLGLGLLRERTKSLLPVIVAHALFNGFNLLLAMIVV